MRACRPRWVATALVVAVSLASRPAAGDWPRDGRALCTASGTQGQPTIVAEGTGGAIVTWHDNRSGNYDIYAQHVLASGAVDSAWPVDGRALCTAAGHQEYPRIVADGAGGAIVTWEDNRSGAEDFYAQHVLASGAVDPAWPVDGRVLCTTPINKFSPAIATDGAGGAIVTWNGGDIYAQHVLASGAIDPAWPVNGRAVSTAPAFQEVPAIVADGAGGAIVTWQDDRGTAATTVGTTKGIIRLDKDYNYNIYAQHVLASGAVDPAWPVDGQALCTAAGPQYEPTLVGDGTGGAIVAWSDLRSGGNPHVYAQHVSASGVVDAAWPANGRALSASLSQWGPSMASDQTGGAIVAWQDSRNGNYDTYAQHLLASGALDATWPLDGRALCTAVNEQVEHAIVSDGAGGAIATWTDYRTGIDYDIYAHHVLASGALDGTWPVNGGALCAAPGFQEVPVITADGAGGAIVAWQDSRSGVADIYAMHVPGSGAVSVPGGAPVSELTLERPSPNPARSVVTLRFAMPGPARVSLAIFDQSGRRVRTVADGSEATGEQTFTWDLHDAAGREVGSGLYFVRLGVAGRVFSRKLVVTR
jgi:flagellar hook capping protein FlgD